MTKKLPRCSICNCTIKTSFAHSWLKLDGGHLLCPDHHKMVYALASRLDNYGSAPYNKVLAEYRKTKKKSGKKKVGWQKKKMCVCCQYGNAVATHCEDCSKNHHKEQKKPSKPVLLLTPPKQAHRNGRREDLPSCGEKGHEDCPDCGECHECSEMSTCGACGVCVGEYDVYYCEACDTQMCDNHLFCGTCDCCDECCECTICGECGENTDDCACYPEDDVATETWELPEKFDLLGAAATFYLRADMAAADEAYQPAFAACAAEIAPVFAAYLDMAIGGELRYGNGSSGDHARGLMPRIMECYKQSISGSGGTRGRAWVEWKKLRQEHGIDILQEAEHALLEGKWRSGIGGRMWGEAAHLLRFYEEGEISTITFVDSAFGLEHNNGCIFNKRWEGPKRLKSLLDSNLQRDEELHGPLEKKASWVSGTPVLLLTGPEEGKVREVRTVEEETVTIFSEHKRKKYTRGEVVWGMDLVIHFAPESEKRRYLAWRRYSDTGRK